MVLTGVITPRSAVRALDPKVLGLLAGSIGLLSLGIVEASDWGWGSARTLAAFAGAAVLAAAFVRRSFTHHHPVLELHLFRVRSFAVACFGIGVFSLGFYAVLLSNVLFLTGVWHYSILTAGFAVTPGPLMAAFSSASARLVVSIIHGSPSRRGSMRRCSRPS